MRTSLALTALCAATALAADVQKRSYKTEVVVVTVTETVFPGTEPTVVPEPDAPVNKNPDRDTPPPPPQEQNPPNEDKPIIGENPGKQDPKPKPQEPKPQPQEPKPEPEKPNPKPQQPEKPNNPNPQQPEKPNPQPQQPQQPEQPYTTKSDPQPTQQPDPSPVTGYKNIVLEHHNMHRANHSAQPLQWDEKLVDSARKLADSCVYGHNTDYNGGGYGQNIGYGIGAQDVGMMITNLMYNEEFGYFENEFGVKSPAMSGFEKWGHLTQILWKDTTHVGCVTTNCKSLQNVDNSPSEAIPYTVCNYSPPGNYAGRYAQNVGKPLGRDQRIAS